MEHCRISNQPITQPFLIIELKFDMMTLYVERIKSKDKTGRLQEGSTLALQIGSTSALQTGGTAN